MKYLLIAFTIAVIGGLWWLVYNEAGPYTSGTIIGIIVGSFISEWRTLRALDKINKTTGPFEALKRSRVSDPGREE